MSKQLTTKRKKQKEYSKKWYAENKKNMQEYMKQYYKDNKLELTLYQKENEFKQRGYNQPMKNLVRDNLIKYINKDIKTILTLESEKFYFSKLIPEKKIIVFERELDIYNKMNKTKPKNVSLFLGDISGFQSIDMNIDFIYLDFCGNWSTEKETILDLRENIKKCKLFAVTFCLRDNKKEFEISDYQFDLLNKINELTEINWNVKFGISYKDSVPMITILLENIQ